MGGEWEWKWHWEVLTDFLFGFFALLDNLFLMRILNYDLRLGAGSWELELGLGSLNFKGKRRGIVGGAPSAPQWPQAMC